MAPSGKLRRSENLPDEGLVWAAMPCTAFLHPRDPERLYVVIWANFVEKLLLDRMLLR